MRKRAVEGSKNFGLLLAISIAMIASNARSDESDAYRYQLAAGGNTKVCRHLEEVYNRDFRHFWGQTNAVPRRPLFPHLPGVGFDERTELDLRYSAFPASPEFDAIQWREGRYARDEKGTWLSPLLIADFDIDNDGRQDLVVKMSFMRGFWPSGGSAPGGEDQLFVFDRDELDLSRSVTSATFYGHEGKKRPARIAYDTLGLSARSIRPFILEGVTYLSVYEQQAVDDPKRRRETMWVLKYLGGGGNLGAGKWEPVRANRVCRFRMIAVKSH